MRTNEQQVTSGSGNHTQPRHLIQLAKKHGAVECLLAACIVIGSAAYVLTWNSHFPVTLRPAFLTLSAVGCLANVGYYAQRHRANRKQVSIFLQSLDDLYWDELVVLADYPNNQLHAEVLSRLVAGVDADRIRPVLQVRAFLRDVLYTGSRPYPTPAKMRMGTRPDGTTITYGDYRLAAIRVLPRITPPEQAREIADALQASRKRMQFLGEPANIMEAYSEAEYTLRELALQAGQAKELLRATPDRDESKTLLHPSTAENAHELLRSTNTDK
jgi:hypothetical protein